MPDTRTLSAPEGRKRNRRLRLRLVERIYELDPTDEIIVQARALGSTLRYTCFDGERLHQGISREYVTLAPLSGWEWLKHFIMSERNLPYDIVPERAMILFDSVSCYMSTVVLKEGIRRGHFEEVPV